MAIHEGIEPSMPRTLITVGISDCGVSDNPEAVLATHALGSCIAVAIYDPQRKVGGLLHLMLPDSGTDREKARLKPYMFADTGIPELFLRSYDLGATKQRLRVSVMGGAEILRGNDSFQIGKRNHMATRKILWKAGVMVHHEDVGGTLPRTVHMDVATGKIVISNAGVERELAPAYERKLA